MENGNGVKNLLPAIIILSMTVLLLGLGLTILSKLGVQARTDAGVVDEQARLWFENLTTLEHDYITTTSATFVNQSDDSFSAVIWDNPGSRSGSAVMLSASAPIGLNGSLINISYNYGASSNAQAAVDSSVTGLDDFVDWIGIIVIALAGGIVFVLVMNAFKGKD